MGMRGGQGCLYLDELKLFIGADLSWGVDLSPFTECVLFFTWIRMIEGLLKLADLLETLLPDGIPSCGQRPADQLKGF